MYGLAPWLARFCDESLFIYSPGTRLVNPRVDSLALIRRAKAGSSLPQPLNGEEVRNVVDKQAGAIEHLGSY